MEADVGAARHLYNPAGGGALVVRNPDSLTDSHVLRLPKIGAAGRSDWQVMGGGEGERAVVGGDEREEVRLCLAISKREEGDCVSRQGAIDGGGEDEITLFESIQSDGGAIGLSSQRRRREATRRSASSPSAVARHLIVGAGLATLAIRIGARDASRACTKCSIYWLRSCS